MDFDRWKGLVRREVSDDMAIGGTILQIAQYECDGGTPETGGRPGDYCYSMSPVVMAYLRSFSARIPMERTDELLTRLPRAVQTLDRSTLRTNHLLEARRTARILNATVSAVRQSHVHIPPEVYDELGHVPYVMESGCPVIDAAVSILGALKAKVQPSSIFSVHAGNVAISSLYECWWGALYQPAHLGHHGAIVMSVCNVDAGFLLLDEILKEE